jgi:hypothetical protein
LLGSSPFFVSFSTASTIRASSLDANQFAESIAEVR